MVEVLRACIKNGLIFPEFEAAYETLIEIFQTLGEIEYLLLSNA